MSSSRGGMISDVVIGARLLGRLPAFLRRGVSLDEARAVVTHRLARRQVDFLALVRRAIYEHPASPYRRLLQLAGCEYGDLERLVGREGVEGALEVLFGQGVYLTVDEFKGRHPAVRGGTSVDVRPEDLLNPATTLRVPRHTGGSRGSRAHVPFDLAHVHERAVGVRLYLDARGGHRWRHATWEAPGGGTMVHLLEYSLAGARMERWFTPIAPAARGLYARYRWTGRVLWLSGLLAGRPQPVPTHVPLDDALPIARWMAEALRRGDTPHVFTYSSCGVRLARAARAAGINLRGARLTLVGEPFTPARWETVRQAGMEAVPRYGSAEASAIASGCLAPRTSDDMHVLEDMIALIQPGAAGARAGLPPLALLVSSLRATAPMVMLNVSLGDQAEIDRISCGCPMERRGWTAHLRAVRSFEKLTAGGMTFLDGDVIPVLEEVLPGRFGGGPIDYQLVESEGVDGSPLVQLLVHPSVGAVDPRAIAEVFLTALARGADAERLMAMQWRQAGLPVVERRPPHVTGSGKVLHLHDRRGETSSPRRGASAHS